MSEKRLDGWEPAETTVYFDGDGEPCRAADAYTSVTTRETEWDDEQVGRMLALAQFEAETTCPCGCGLPVDVAHDPQGVFVTDTVICRARAVLTAAQRDFEQSHLPPDQRDKKWVAEKPARGPSKPRPGDGVLWKVAPYQPNVNDHPEVQSG